jgi:molybdate-binding protein
VDATLAPARGRVGLVGSRWVAHPLDPREVAAADVLRDGTSSHLLQPDGLEALRGRLLLSGCAPALGVLVEHLRRGAAPVDAVWIHATTEAALAQLARGETHVAGVHLVAGDTARRGRRHALTLARWRQGLLVRRGQRGAPRSIDDLGRRGLRVARREAGASANRLLDQALARAGVRLTGTSVEARGHLGVAQAVALGAADVGVAAEPAALAHGLGFIPLDEEHFDLVFDRARADDPRLVRLGEVLASRAFREDLASLGGYDTAHTGQPAGTT